MWDDSNSAHDFGGSCLTQQEAAQMLQDPARSLQEVTVQLSNDGHLDTWGATNVTDPLEIRYAICIYAGCWRHLRAIQTVI